MMLVPANDTLSDAEFQVLLARAKQGDSDALSTLWSCVERYLMKIANDELPGALKPRLGASDLVQTVFERFQKRIVSFEGKEFGALRAWVKTILRNAMIDETRRADADPTLGNTPAGPIPVDPAPSPSSVFRETEERLLLEECLRGLSPDHQDVVTLRTKLNLEFSEIGVRMNRSREAAEKLYARAVEKLAEAMKRRLPPPPNDPPIENP